MTGLFLLAFCLLNLLALLHLLQPTPPSSQRADTFVLQSKWLSLVGFLASFLTMAAALANDTFVAATLGAGLLALVLWNRQALYSRLLPEARRLISERRRRISSEVESSAQGVPVDERIERAAAYVHDALAGRFRGVHWAEGNKSRIYAQRLLQSLRYARALNLTVYLVLAFFERPR